MDRVSNGVSKGNIYVSFILILFVVVTTITYMEIIQEI